MTKYSFISKSLHLTQIPHEPSGVWGTKKVKLNYSEVEVILSECSESIGVLGKVAWVVGEEYSTLSEPLRVLLQTARGLQGVFRPSQLPQGDKINNGELQESSHINTGKILHDLPQSKHVSGSL